MTSAFNKRIVRVTIDIDSTIQEYTNVRIDASGTKFRSAQNSVCEIRIFNLTLEHQQYIITRASPFSLTNLTPINVTLEVGRESYGTFTLFQGACLAAGITQPPDIGIVLQSMTNNYLLSNTQGVDYPATTTLGQIAANLAQTLGCTLQSPSANLSRQIVNYNFTGSPVKQLQRLNEMGVVAYVDNKTLVVVDPEQARSNTVTLIDNLGGLVGVPQATSYGCQVKTLIGQGIEVGGKVKVISAMNPSVNGDYYVETMQFELSNREPPFFYNLNCRNIAYALSSGPAA